MSKIQDIGTRDEFEKALRAAPGQVLVEFVQDDCSYCDDERPKVERLAARCEQLTVLRINADASEELDQLAKEFHLEAAPTLFYAESGHEMRPEKAVELEDVRAVSKLLKGAKK